MLLSFRKSAAHRALGTPELLASVAEHVERGQRVTLLLVNRFFFRTTAFRVWFKLYDLRNFLRLLIVGGLPEDDQAGVTPVSLEAVVDLSAIQSERVSLYAKLVRVLFVGQRFGGYEWIGLNSLKQPTALFPNLAEIQIIERRHGTYPYKLASILSVFCDPGQCSIIRAPGLVTPHYADNSDWEAPWIVAEDALPALEAVFPHGPFIQQFDFLVVADPGGRFFGGWPRLVQALNQMTRLTSLALCCGSLCEEVVLAAGSLQVLSTLSLCSANMADPSDDSLSSRLSGSTFDDVLFPRLSVLVCIELSLREAIAILSIQPLAARVQVAKLNFSDVDWLDPQLDQVFHLLRIGTRELKHLYLSLPHPQDRDDPHLLTWRTRLSATLFHIPLSSFYVVNLFWPFDAPAGFLFGTCGPWQMTLTHLTLYNQHVSPSDLPAFTTCSALEELYIALWVLEVPPAENAYLSRPMSSRTIRLKSTFPIILADTDSLAL